MTPQIAAGFPISYRQQHCCAIKCCRGKGGILVLHPQTLSVTISSVYLPWISWYLKLWCSLNWFLLYWEFFFWDFSLWSLHGLLSTAPVDPALSRGVDYDLQRPRPTSTILWSTSETIIENKEISMENTLCSLKEISCRTNKCHCRSNLTYFP